MGSSSNKAMTPSLGGVSSAQSTTGRSYRRGGSRTQPTTPTQPTSNTSYRSYRRGGSRTQPTAPTQPTQPTQPTTPTQPPKSVPRRASKLASKERKTQYSGKREASKL